VAAVQETAIEVPRSSQPLPRKVTAKFSDVCCRNTRRCHHSNYGFHPVLGMMRSKLKIGLNLILHNLTLLRRVHCILLEMISCRIGNNTLIEKLVARKRRSLGAPTCWVWHTFNVICALSLHDMDRSAIPRGDPEPQPAARCKMLFHISCPHPSWESVGAAQLG
jgi:hypothetical protein